MEIINYSPEETNKIENNIIFTEYVYLIVCCIDNIVHPPSHVEDNQKEEAILIGERSITTLLIGLEHFFNNQCKI